MTDESENLQKKLQLHMEAHFHHLSKKTCFLQMINDLYNLQL